MPKEFYNILLVASHSNPIGGHFNAYRTLHLLRFYWPGMYTYIMKICTACFGCSLTNAKRSSELIYGFPCEAPFNVVHIDRYQAGKHSILQRSRYESFHPILVAEQKILEFFRPSSNYIPLNKRRTNPKAGSSISNASMGMKRVTQVHVLPPSGR